MKNRHDFFNHMAEHWDEERIETVACFKRVVNEARLAPGQKVLDVGTGTGVLIPFLAKNIGPCGQIHAIDYAENMIEKLNDNGVPENVKPAVMDIHETCYPDMCFDRVIANSCYPHFDDKPRALAEIHRILKQDGLFILSHPTGRDHVNRIHRDAHPVIERDILPEPESLLPRIISAGFEALKVIDQPGFFLICCKKTKKP